MFVWYKRACLIFVISLFTAYLCDWMWKLMLSISGHRRPSYIILTQVKHLKVNDELTTLLTINNVDHNSNFHCVQNEISWTLWEYALNYINLAASGHLWSIVYHKLSHLYKILRFCHLLCKGVLDFKAYKVTMNACDTRTCVFGEILNQLFLQSHKITIVILICDKCTRNTKLYFLLLFCKLIIYYCIFLCNLSLWIKIVILGEIITIFAHLSLTSTHDSIQIHGNKFPSSKTNNKWLPCYPQMHSVPLVAQLTTVWCCAVCSKWETCMHERSAEDSTSETAVSLTDNRWPRSIWMQQQHDVYIANSQWVLSILPSPWWRNAAANPGLQPPLYIFGWILPCPDKTVTSSRKFKISKDKSAAKAL